MRARFRILTQIFTMLAIIIRRANTLHVNTSNPNASPAAECNKQPSNICNCHCNVHQDATICNYGRTVEGKLDQLLALVNKSASSTEMRHPTSLPDASVSSCKEQFENDNSSKSQVYELKFGQQKVPVYCHMGNFGCGDGGWTLAMKTDGTKNTFHFKSHVWTDKYSVNLEGGTTGFDYQETKLPTYWSTPFSKICLGMKIGQQINFTVITRRARSLFSLIADGTYRATSLGRKTWKNLIGSDASLQLHCNKEGFNAVGFRRGTAKARIGIIGNDKLHCGLCNSRIGYGTGGNPDMYNTCGNEAADRNSDNGPKSIRAMGYILVQ
ncbi:uncharacterized skeletal organic matrix protein 5-like isoform X1 [Montipora capricornis]|uniref:uncharacterized skeletal organic matrix protein 5-like isoform X1 n=2 Tax=Montipora capricornis TaxID=246305 RepID=UPI0035F213E9